MQHRPGCYAPSVARAPAGLLAASLALGCVGPAAEDSTDESSEATETGTTEPRSLIDHEAWEVVPAAEDPLAEHRPETVECGIAGWYVEGDTTEIDTNFCNYLALRQGSLEAIAVGDDLRLSFYHFDLTAPEQADAHFAVLVDGEVVWEELITIPGGTDKADAFVYTYDTAAEFDAPAGTEIGLHLHNHGQNTWALQELSVTPG